MRFASLSVVAVLRPDQMLLWLPESMATRLNAHRGVVLNEEQWADRELQALIFSRQKANESGLRCDADWHRKNGYA